MSVENLKTENQKSIFINLIQKIKTLNPKDNATEFQTQVEFLMTELGLRVHREWRVSDRGDGRPGFIDLVSEDPIRVAVEIDFRFPRQKSIFKLRKFDGFRVVILRNPDREILSKTISDIEIVPIIFPFSSSTRRTDVSSTGQILKDHPTLKGKG